MLQFNSALLAAAGLFVGAFSPYQSIHIQPHGGGVLVAASDHGRITALGFDPAGRGDEICDLIADDKLLQACRGIKAAERDVRIEDQRAIVTTYRKTTNESKEFAILRASTPFPPLESAVAACVQRWSATPEVSATAGRYDATYLEKAVKAAGLLCNSLVLSAFDGGPLRLQGEGLELMILVMPQTAEPIPPIPDWVLRFSEGQ
ncbi:MAG: hypothetical protein ACO4AL_11690 [Steroidobacteraceae bacterium]